MHAADNGSAALLSSFSDILNDRRAILAAVQTAQDAAAAVEQRDALGGVAFGASWRSTGSDWAELQSVAAWVHANEDIPLLCSRKIGRESVRERVCQYV